MSNFLRLDAVKLNATASPDEFEAFVTKELFPAFKAAFAGPSTRKTLAHLDGLVLLANRSDADNYTIMSAWSGRLEDVAGKDFARITMAAHDEAVAALLKLETFGARGDPQLYEPASGSVEFS